MSNGPIRIFIGSGEASRIERKTLIYSLKKHTTRPMDIFVFNGTHNTIEHGQKKPYLAPMPLHIKYRNITEFSNYRFLIPDLCGYQGRAIYVDSDTLVFKDIGELYDVPMNGYDFLAKAEAYQSNAEGHRWGLSVMLIDCERCHFDLERYFEEIDNAKYTLHDMHEMTTKFLKHHPFKIGKIDARWNSFDKYNQDTRLIHYTNLLKQPWKFHGHRYGVVWHQYLHEAIEAGYVTVEDIELSKCRGYVRQDLLQGNNPNRLLRTLGRTRIAKWMSMTTGRGK